MRARHPSEQDEFPVFQRCIAARKRQQWLFEIAGQDHPDPAAQRSKLVFDVRLLAGRILRQQLPIGRVGYADFEHDVVARQSVLDPPHELIGQLARPVGQRSRVGQVLPHSGQRLDVGEQGQRPVQP